MAKAQLSIEALLTFAAFLAFIAALISAEKSVISDSRAASSFLNAQSEADASALELNILAGDGWLASFNFVPALNCTFACGAYSYCCIAENATGRGRLVRESTGWRTYGTYSTLPI